MKARKGRIGSSHDEYLREAGIYEEASARAIKRVIARQLNALMRDQGLTKSELAKRMQTSRAQLDRLLDPENQSVTLATLTRAAHVVGRQLKMELEHVHLEWNREGFPGGCEYDSHCMLEAEASMHGTSLFA